MLLACTLLASAAALTAARADLDKGRPAQVLVDLDAPGAIAPGEQAEAARLLAAAAEAAKGLGDGPLALQLAQRASRTDPGQALALSLLASWSLDDREFAAARRYGDRWAKLAPDDPAQRRFQERLAKLDAEWRPGLEEQPARPVRERKPRPPARSAHAAPEPARALPPVTSKPPAAAPPIAGAHRIVLYGDARSRACEEARKWLRARKLPFFDRDLESDPRAALELKARQRAAGGGFRGLPMVEIDGRLLAGFDAAAWEAALGAQ